MTSLTWLWDSLLWAYVKLRNEMIAMEVPALTDKVVLPMLQVFLEQSAQT